MARRKILVAMMMHETNTFSPVPTPLTSFRPLSGPAAIQEFQDTNTQLGGFLHVAKETGAEIVVPLAAGAHPSGYVERAAYEDMCEAIVGGIRNGCDAAFLAPWSPSTSTTARASSSAAFARWRPTCPSPSGSISTPT
jgi:microcystin degradation protein MlrC